MKKIKKIILFLVLFILHNSNVIGKNNPLEIYVLIKSNDCVNCYAGYYFIKPIIANFKQFYDIKYLVDDIAKDDIKYFLSDKFKLDTNAITIDYSKSNFKKYNSTLQSRIVITKNDSIIFSKKFIELNKNEFENIILENADLYDYTGIINESINKIVAAPNNKILIYNPARNRLLLDNIKSKTSVKYFPANSNILDSLYQILVNKSSITEFEKKYNLKYYKEKDNIYEQGRQLISLTNEIKCFADNFYLLVEFSYVKTIINKSDTNEADYNHSMILKLDTNLIISDIYDMPEEVDSSKFYIQTDGFNITEKEVVINAKNWKLENTYSIVKFTNHNNKLEVKSIKNLKIPDSWPLRNAQGMKYYYPLISSTDRDISYYFFIQNNLLYDFNGINKPFLLNGLTSNTDSITRPTIYLQQLKKIGNSWFLIAEDNKKIYCIKFDSNFNYIKKKYIVDAKFSRVDIDNEKIIYSTPIQEKFYLGIVYLKDL